jgi:hypothetical protein
MIASIELTQGWAIVMEQLDVNTHSFIVKIWIEEAVDEAGGAGWRGHVTHVQSGQRRYVRSLDEIVAFIGPYLESLGAQLDPYQKIRLWLRRWKTLVTGRR